MHHNSCKSTLGDSSVEDPTQLAAYLDALVAFLERYVAFPTKHEPVAIALWVVMTYLFDQFPLVPYLAVTSPIKRCGKSRVLDCLELVVHRPWRVTLPSEAVLFRKIEQDRPSLLLDEVDPLFQSKSRDAEPLRAILNAGFARGTKVPRVVVNGRKMEIRDFDVYGPKALACIGRLPDTVADRSIPIALQRRRPADAIARFRARHVEVKVADLRLGLEALAGELDLRDAEPELPTELGDRAQDIWEPLLAIAEAAGSEWAERARQAAIHLNGTEDADEDALGVKLLQDIRQVFEDRAEDSLWTESLLQSLRAMEVSPWAELRGGSGLSPRGLAGLLKPFGIAPDDIRAGELVRKGYRREWFRSAWERYLKPLCPSLEGESIRYAATDEANVKIESADL